MKIFDLKKLPIYFTLLIFVLMLFAMPVSASDYKYKVLDTKYNPSAVKLLETNNQTTLEDTSVPLEKKGFDFLRFLATIAMFLFPAMVLKYSCKTFVKVFDELKEKGVDYVEEDKKDEEETEEEKNNEETVDEKTTIQEETKPAKVEKTTVPIKKQVKILQKTEPTAPITKETTKKPVVQNTANATSPIQSKKTVMLDKAKLTKTTGLCTIKHDNKFALIGYINSKVFLLKKFDELPNTEVRPRWTETVNNKDRYIVRLGTSYKALVEVGEKDINLLIEL